MAGLRATRISFNAEMVDVTTLDSAGGWRELLTGAGVKTASISGSGIFKDAGTDERARQVFFDGEAPAWQVIIPDFGIVEGAFQLTSIEYLGRLQRRGDVRALDGFCRSIGVHGALMANPWAGEVDITLDGKPHTLKLTLGALAELEASMEVRQPY